MSKPNPDDSMQLSLTIAHERALETLKAAEALCDYAEHIESALSVMLDYEDVMLVFPSVEDLKAKGANAEHVVKVYVGSDFLVSCCGSDPEMIIHRLFRWVGEMFNTEEEQVALA